MKKRSAVSRFRENDVQLVTLGSATCSFGPHLRRKVYQWYGIQIDLALT